MSSGRKEIENYVIARETISKAAKKAGQKEGKVIERRLDWGDLVLYLVGVARILS